MYAERFHVKQVLLSIGLSFFGDVRIDHVYDGDTFFVTIPDLPDVFGERIGVRVKGIDAPEIRDARQCMRALAQRSKLALETVLGNGKVNLTHCERDKYFRVLCNIQVAEKFDVGSYMIDAGLAKPYSGDTKLKWTCR